MIGFILILASYLLLKLEGKTLAVLGFNHPSIRLREFFIGLIGAGVFATLPFLLSAYWAEFSWQRNPDYGTGELLNSLRWNWNSVVFEELAFHGYLLYQLVRYIGPTKACWLSAAAFGIYHWFSYGVLGNWQAMVYVFLLTGAFGFMLAYAFVKTKSVILPIGLHLGWNLVTNLVFSSGPIGQQLLIANKNHILLESSHALIANLLVPFSFVITVIMFLTKSSLKNKRPT